jgi:NADH-quinone oxidoreductase subunit J
MLIAFYIAAAVAVLATIVAITRNHAVHALLYLIVSLLAIAIVFYVIGAPFLAALELIIYAGAIMVLFLFVVMLLNAPHEQTEHDLRARPRLRGGPLRGGAVLALALIVELVWALTKGGGESGVFPAGAVTSVAAIGRSLFTDYAFAFEVTSILILISMVGAVVLARREPGTK